MQVNTWIRCAQTLGTFAVALWCAAATAKGEEIKTPAGTDLLRPSTALSFQLLDKDAGHSELKQVSVAGQPFAQVAQVHTTQKMPRAYDTQVIARAEGISFQKGDKLLATFYLRNAEPNRSETGEAPTEFLVQQTRPPSFIFARLYVGAGAGWEKYHLPFIAGQDCAAGDVQITFRVGYEPVTLEIGAVQVTKFGPDVAFASLPVTSFHYAGREADVRWRKAAEQRIETIRKADLTVLVTDARQAHSQAKVAVAMCRHAFPFGCAAKDQMLVGDQANTSDNRCYRELFGRLFNAATSEYLSWRWWSERQEGKLSREGLRWMHDNHLRTPFAESGGLFFCARVAYNEPARINHLIPALMKDQSTRAGVRTKPRNRSKRRFAEPPAARSV